MVKTFSISYLINELHFTDCNDLREWAHDGGRYAFFIHPSVFTKCKMMLKTNLEHDDIWDLPLQIGKNRIDVKLIYLTINKEKMYRNIKNFILQSQFSFPWEDQAILYTSFNTYHMLKEFIDLNYLTSAIKKIEEMENVPVEGEKIKVVTFNKRVNKTNLISEYIKFLRNKNRGDHRYYFFTLAFPWYQPLPQHSEPPIENDNIYFGLRIVFDYLYYLNSHNLFDLIATKLAVCDFRNPHHTNELQIEIDNIIHRTLSKMILNETYIKNNIFDLTQYLMDHNFIPNQICLLNFVYTFQDYFNAVNFVVLQDRKPQSSVICFSTVQIKIQLAEKSYDIGKIRQQSNIQFIIDGTGFDSMSFSLLHDLLVLSNVNEIILDTNHAWVVDDGETNYKAYKINIDKMITIKLFGSNTSNIVEELVEFLKTSKDSKKLDLHINCTIHSYMIFENLELRYLRIEDMHVTPKLLNELILCNLTYTTIYIDNCTIEDNIEVWKLMMDMEQLQNIQIMEGNRTLEFMYEYISNCLIDSDLNKFKLNKNVSIKSDSKIIDFDEIQFSLNEYKTEVLLKNSNNQCNIDLYEMKLRGYLEENGKNDLDNYDDDSDDYDFYQ